MRLDTSGGEVTVTLSRRNLLVLLHKLELPLSARTLTSRNVYQYGKLATGLLIVRAESDEDDYGRRGFPPGPMHPLSRDRWRLNPVRRGSALCGLRDRLRQAL